IVFLVWVGAAALAVSADLLAIGADLPAFSAAPLTVLLLTPSAVRTHLTDPFIFALVAIVFAAMLLMRARRIGWRGTAAIAATAVVRALTAPAVLPSVVPVNAVPAAACATAGLNSLVTLGED